MKNAIMKHGLRDWRKIMEGISLWQKYVYKFIFKKFKESFKRAKNRPTLLEILSNPVSNISSP